MSATPESEYTFKRRSLLDQIHYHQRVITYARISKNQKQSRQKRIDHYYEQVKELDREYANARKQENVSL